MRMMVPFLAAGMRADSGVEDAALLQAQPIVRRNALAMSPKG